MRAPLSKGDIYVCVCVHIKLIYTHTHTHVSVFVLKGCLSLQILVGRILCTCIIVIFTEWPHPCLDTGKST